MLYYWTVFRLELYRTCVWPNMADFLSLTSWKVSTNSWMFYDSVHLYRVGLCSSFNPVSLLLRLLPFCDKLLRLTLDPLVLQYLVQVEFPQSVSIQCSCVSWLLYHWYLLSKSCCPGKFLLLYIQTDTCLLAFFFDFFDEDARFIYSVRGLCCDNDAHFLQQVYWLDQKFEAKISKGAVSVVSATLFTSMLRYLLSSSGRGSMDPGHFPSVVTGKKHWLFVSIVLFRATQMSLLFYSNVLSVLLFGWGAYRMILVATLPLFVSKYGGCRDPVRRTIPAFRLIVLT